MRSLRSRLFLLWAVSLLAALAVGTPLVQLYRAQGAAVEGRETARLVRACEDMSARYDYLVSGWAASGRADADPDFRAGLRAVRSLVLRDMPDLQAGIWQQDDGILEPADLDPALRDAVATVAAGAVADAGDAALSLSTGGGMLFLRACALRGPVAGLAGFVVARSDAAPGLAQAGLGLGVLFALVLTTSIGVGIVVVGYSRRIGAIEAALATQGPDLPRLALTGERDLDRLVTAFNRAGESLAEGRAREAALSARVVQAERLAALGRVAAGVAHEIRNPVAAIRLRAENALAGDAARREAALGAILTQTDRLERLVGELLDMTRAQVPAPEPVALADLLRAEAGAEAEIAAPDATVRLDPALLARALGNLLRNARRAAGPEGRVALTATLAPGWLTLEVADSGAGVDPALRATLFEPFVTGHADGTGLGLAIAREAVRAMGGTLELADPGGDGHGARFSMRIPVPWPAS